MQRKEPIKEFGDFGHSDMEEEIVKKLGDKARCAPMSAMFYEVHPIIPQAKQFKEKFKPEGTSAGMFTQLHQQARADKVGVVKAREKVRENKLPIDLENYSVPDAAIKLHISINQMAKLSQDAFLGLIELLTKEAIDPKNKMAFHFKTSYASSVHLEHGDPRFKDNDQLTLYFDKYSSTGDILRLAKKIDDYLKQHIPENKKHSEDKIHLSSFVSARFDTFRLLEKYGVYHFFDIELQKFIEANKDSAILDSIPLCAFEVVFYHILIADDIRNFHAGQDQEQGLSKEDSDKVQAQFAEMAKDPIAFMNPKKPKTQEAIQAEHSIKDKLSALMKEVAEIRIDVSKYSSKEALEGIIKQHMGFLDKALNSDMVMQAIRNNASDECFALQKAIKQKKDELKRLLDFHEKEKTPSEPSAAHERIIVGKKLKDIDASRDAIMEEISSEEEKKEKRPVGQTPKPGLQVSSATPRSAQLSSPQLSMPEEVKSQQPLGNIMMQLLRFLLSEHGNAFWHQQGKGIYGTKTPASIKEYREILEGSLEDRQKLELMQNLANRKLREYKAKNVETKRSEFLKNLHKAILFNDEEALNELVSQVMKVAKKPSRGLSVGLFQGKASFAGFKPAYFLRLAAIIEDQFFWHTQGVAIRGTKTPDSIKQYRSILSNRELNVSDKWKKMQELAKRKLVEYEKKDLIEKRSPHLLQLHKCILNINYEKLQELEETRGGKKEKKEKK